MLREKVADVRKDSKAVNCFLNNVSMKTEIEVLAYVSRTMSANLNVLVDLCISEFRRRDGLIVCLRDRGCSVKNYVAS